MKELIFIYNAKSGLINSMIDWGHKIYSPDTYPCSLCSLTYDNLGKIKKWRSFLKSLNINCIFKYKDELHNSNYLQVKELPCILVRNNSTQEIFMNSNELNEIKNLDKLIELINSRLDNV